ncbi:hypothetical protein EON80_06055, partial [bacterium]
MKLKIWIGAPLALAAGLLPLTTPAALSQDSKATNDVSVAVQDSNSTPSTPAVAPAPAAVTASPSAAPAAPKPAPASAASLAPILVWDSQVTGAGKVGSWGNGSGEVTRGRTGSTLQVKTLNLEEGVRFDLDKPIDLAPFRQSGFWRIRLQTSGTSQRGGRGGRGRTPATTSTQGAPAPLTQVGLKLILDDGVMAGMLPIRQSGRGGRGGQAQS